MTRGRGSGGQATVELVLVLPMVVLALLLVIQVGLVARSHVVVVNAARVGARAGAVHGTVAAARAAVANSPGIEAHRVTSRVDLPSEPGGSVRVSVRVRVSTDVALVGPLVGEPELEASASMRSEVVGVAVQDTG